MRLLTALILIAAGLWSGYWYTGQSAKRQVIEAWLSERRAAGWTAEYGNFTIAGFPNRFDSSFTDLALASPDSGIGWQAPFLQILALSYQPNHIIAAFANNQTVTLPLEDVAIASHDMMASVVFEPDSRLALSRLTLQAEDLALTGSSGWQAGAGQLSLATRQSAAGDFAHDLVFEAADLVPTELMRRSLDPKGRLPARLQSGLLDLTMDFDAPWDRIAVETGAPLVTGLSVNRLDLRWGTLGLAASGDFEVAHNGRISGRLDLEIRNWRYVLDLFVAAGIVTPANAETIRTGLDILTSGAADPDILKAPLVLDGERMSLGPVPLGPAPYFVR
ncbi:MAG: DUF2125 domain-containing protein [Rhodobacteraceae bacterium]|nr:DUF2125 domain-containing protein [Paracoccaceae bacterium]